MSEVQQPASLPDPEPPPPRDVVLAVSIGPGAFEAGLVTARGSLIARSKVEVEPDVGPESHYTALATMVVDLQDLAPERYTARIRGIGVISAGPATRGLETVSPVGLTSWRDFPLRSRIAELTGQPMFGNLEAKGLALAEGWVGAAQGHLNFCEVTVSSSIAGAVVLDGELLDGESGGAGDIAHIVVEPGGRRCRCGTQGCFDAEASGSAIEAITGRPPSEPTYEIMQRTGRIVGRAAAMVCNAFDLSLVVVGGTVSTGFGATFFHAAQTSLDEHAQLAYSRGARITPSRLGDSGSLVGAGAVGWRGVRRSRRERPSQPL